MNTNELTGAALNWAVAKSQGNTGNFTIDGYSPSTDWSQGGPIIEREKIRLDPRESSWYAQIWDGEETEVRYCPTPLIAAMRCYVASKLGDTVELPEGLTP